MLRRTSSGQANANLIESEGLQSQINGRLGEEGTDFGLFAESVEAYQLPGAPDDVLIPLYNERFPNSDFLVEYPAFVGVLSDDRPREEGGRECDHGDRCENDQSSNDYSGCIRARTLAARENDRSSIDSAGCIRSRMLVVRELDDYSPRTAGDTRENDRQHGCKHGRVQSRLSGRPPYDKTD